MSDDHSIVEWPREDVRDVPLQGSYVAKQCPVRAQLDHDRLHTAMRAPETLAQRARMDAGNEFEAAIFARLAATDLHVVHVPATGPADRERATVAAMTDGAHLILAAQLPLDGPMRRVGQPDALLRVGARHDGERPWRYLPIDVKHHSLARRGRGGARWSPLDQPDPTTAHTDAEVDANIRYWYADGLQLAHYWRMLEAAGWAPDGSVQSPLGGIIDKHERIWWVDLTEGRNQRWWSPDPVSLLRCYDHEFAFRLDVIARTLARNAEPSLPRAVHPVRIGECNDCPWNAVCDAELREHDHVSLLPGSTWTRFVTLRREGLLTRAALAQLDWTTADIVHGNHRSAPVYDLRNAYAAARAHTEPQTPVTEVVTQPQGLLQRLHDHGIATVGDLAALHEPTVMLPTTGIGHLPTLIDAARASVAGRPLRSRRAHTAPVPRGTVEVDVDMENVDAGVYLWGVLTNVRASTPQGAPRVPLGYHAFATWQPLDPAAEAALVAQLWAHLDACRRLAHAAGGTLRVYCYSRAEARMLRGILAAAGPTPGVPTHDELEAFLASDEWVDMLDVVQVQAVSPAGYSLKTTARWSGFDWRDADPGGVQSMSWYEEAAHGRWWRRRRFRTRLLRYNEDDVRATLALREWLEHEGPRMPSCSDWPSPA